jgi:hypothetical protein
MAIVFGDEDDGDDYNKAVLARMVAFAGNRGGCGEIAAGAGGRLARGSVPAAGRAEGGGVAR